MGTCLVQSVDLVVYNLHRVSKIHWVSVPCVTQTPRVSLTGGPPLLSPNPKILFPQLHVSPDLVGAPLQTRMSGCDYFVLNTMSRMWMFSC
jgi:hypothetical protein